MVVGVVALLDNFDILPGGFWEFFWPILLIVLGIAFVSRSKCKSCHWNMFKNCPHCNNKKDKE